MSEKISLNDASPCTQVPREKSKKKTIEKKKREKRHHLRGNGDDFVPGYCENASYTV